MKFDPRTGKTSVFREPSGRANGLIFDFFSVSFSVVQCISLIRLNICFVVILAFSCPPR